MKRPAVVQIFCSLRSRARQEFQEIRPIGSPRILASAHRPARKVAAVGVYICVYLASAPAVMARSVAGVWRRPSEDPVLLRFVLERCKRVCLMQIGICATVAQDLSYKVYYEYWQHQVTSGRANVPDSLRSVAIVQSRALHIVSRFPRLQVDAIDGSCGSCLLA